MPVIQISSTHRANRLSAKQRPRLLDAGDRVHTVLGGLTDRLIPSQLEINMNRPDNDSKAKMSLRKENSLVFPQFLFLATFSIRRLFFPAALIDVQSVLFSN